MGDKCFFDSNILVYLISNDEPRTAVAKALVDLGGTVSVQVLNEFANVALKKFRLKPAEIVEALMPIKDAFDVVPLELETHELALTILSSTNLGLHDANIVAAADLAGCNILYSEDMSHGQRVGGVTIVNPFRAG